jgi:hypothetical protein
MTKKGNSTGCYAKNSFEIDHFDGDYVYWKKPQNYRVNIHTGEVEKLITRGERKDCWIVAPDYSTKSGAVRLRTMDYSSISKARLVYMSYHPTELDDKRPVIHKDGDKTNYAEDNLILGTLGMARGYSKGEFDPEWEKKVWDLLPDPKTHNRKNPTYMKLVNQRVGKDGLTHSQRFVKKMKDQGRRLFRGKWRTAEEIEELRK